MHKSIRQREKPGRLTTEGEKATERNMKRKRQIDKCTVRKRNRHNRNRQNRNKKRNKQNRNRKRNRQNGNRKKKDRQINNTNENMKGERQKEKNMWE